MLAGLTTFNANAGGGDMLTGGTFIHVGLLMPTNSYAVEELSNLKTSPVKSVGLGLSLQFGQLFEIVEFSDIGIGFKMTWIELEGANTAFDDGITSGKGYAFQGSLFKLGPEFSFWFRSYHGN